MSNSTKRRGIGPISTRSAIRNNASSVANLVSSAVEEGDDSEPTAAPVALTAVPESGPEGTAETATSEPPTAEDTGQAETQEQAPPTSDTSEIATRDELMPSEDIHAQPEVPSVDEVEDAPEPIEEKKPAGPNPGGRAGRSNAGNSKSGKGEANGGGTDFTVPSGLLPPKTTKSTKQLGTRISTAVSEPFDEYAYTLKRHGYTQASLLEFAINELMERYPAEQLIKSITGKK